jgi:hypothetical protein
MLLETIKKNAGALREAGPAAVERAKRMGVPAYYGDKQGLPGFIKQYPDGRQERVTLVDGEEVSLEPVSAPR